MSHTQPRTVLFAGGGTGGHLFPALAIAEELLERAPGMRVRFLASPRTLDAEILRAERLAGAPPDFEAIPARPFGVHPGTLARFLLSWGGAVRAGRAAIRRAEAPVVVAMGGFVAAPCVQAARAEGVPVLMVNLDATPGRANRWIARHAGRVLTAAAVEGAAWEVVPPIVRRSARPSGDAASCRGRFGLDADRPTLLVTGASQGASSMNRLLAAMVARDPGVFTRGGWQVIHQTGKADVEETRSAYRGAGIPSVVEPFLREMGTAWGAATVAVSRAGAGLVAESWANRVPTLFLPYPFHRDQHQRRNAEPLVRAGAAELATDHVHVEANLTRTAPAIAALMNEPERRERLARGLAALGPADGAARVAEAILRGRS